MKLIRVAPLGHGRKCASVENSSRATPSVNPRPTSVTLLGTSVCNGAPRRARAGSCGPDGRIARPCAFPGKGKGLMHNGRLILVCSRCY